MRATNIIQGTVFCLLALFATSTAQTARAAVLTQTIQDTGSLTCCGFGGNFNQFNPALGTLNNVEFVFNIIMAFDTSFFIAYPDYCASNICGADYGYSVAFSFNAPGFPLIGDFNYCCGSANDFFAIFGAGGEALASDLSPQSSGPIQYGPTIFSPDVGAFGSYEGLGIVHFVGGESEDSDYCITGGLGCSLSRSADITTTLKYDYTPVPEPSSLLMLLGGLGLIGGALRFGCKSTGLVS